MATIKHEQGVQLGDKVSYVRLGDKDAELRGVGIVFAFYLNEDYRVSVRIRDTETGQPVNTDLIAVNCTEEGEKKYLAHMRGIEAIAEQSRQENLDMVKRYNDQIEELEVAYKGPKVTL